MTGLAHTGDPDTSHTAVIRLDPQARLNLKEALLTLLDGHPMTDDELTAAYVSEAEAQKVPPLMDLHSVKRRRSELHTRHHVVMDTGLRRPSLHRKPSVVWALRMPVDEARLIVKGNL
jgi:hypothetical protein